VKKIKEELLATDLSIWRKKALLVVFLLMSAFPIYLMYAATESHSQSNIWGLRHFAAIAFTQAIAQVSLAYYILKNKVPNYAILSIIIMVLFFQLTFGIAVILVSNV